MVACETYNHPSVCSITKVVFLSVQTLLPSSRSWEEEEEKNREEESAKFEINLLRHLGLKPAQVGAAN